MNTNDILDMIGNARGSYVWDAQQVRSGTAAPKKTISLRRPLLIAALIAMTLLLVGCTVAYAQGWFTDFFAKKTDQPLSPGQVQFIQDHEQIIAQADTQNDWTVEVHSAMTDGSTGYIILGVTAPEGQSLEWETVAKDVIGDVIIGSVEPGNKGIHADRNAPDIFQLPDGVMHSRTSMGWEDDGDGLDNTRNFVIQFTPNEKESTIAPFGPEAIYTICIQDFVHKWEDQEALQQVLEERGYDPDNYILEGDDVYRVNKRETLVEGTWEFEVCFAEETAAQDSLELLTSPVTTRMDVYRSFGENWESGYFYEEITITSFQVKSLTASFAYEDCSGSPTFTYDEKQLWAVMKDGSEIELHCSASGYDGRVSAQAQSPIVLSQLDHVRLVDGTKLYSDGRVESPERATAPSVPAPSELVPGETTLEELCAYHNQEGVYGYLGDFDGDDVQDLAVWWEEAYRVLYLLNHDGTLKQEYHFEERGFDVYHTYNQRSEEIFYEPNLIAFPQKNQGYVYQIRQGELQFRGGWKRDGATRFEATAEDVWKKISNADYERLRGEFQAMDYRLYPIGICWAQ